LGIASVWSLDGVLFVIKKTVGFECAPSEELSWAARRNAFMSLQMLIVFCISGGIDGLAGMALFQVLWIVNSEFYPGYGYHGLLISAGWRRSTWHPVMLL